MEIRARSLSLSFPGAGGLGVTRRRIPAVREVDFRVACGETVALAGRNGSGKTTTLRLLAGLVVPDAGEALLGGEPAFRDRARRGLGYLGEEEDSLPGLSVRETLGYTAALAGCDGAEVGRVVRSLDLEPWLGRRAGRCSLGVRRRVALAGALLGRPGALLLDEPLTGMDPVARARAIRTIRAAAAGGAAVLVTLHDGAAIEALADRLVVLADGRVAREGPVRAFASDPGDWLAAALEERSR